MLCRYRIIAGTVGAALLMSSCSIKEDRTLCPCRLSTDFDEIISDGEYASALVSVYSALGRRIYREEINIRDYEGTGLEVAVPREAVNVTAVFGDADERSRFDGITAAEGVEVDPIFAWKTDVLCEGETMRLKASVHKQFCRLFVSIEAGDAASGNDPWDIRLTALTRGVDLVTLKPAGGEYRVAVRHNPASGTYNVRVPRQGDYDMVLELYEGDAELTAIDVGSYMWQCGYDWGKEDLDDVYVTINRSEMSVDMKLVPWDGKLIEVVI